MANELRVRSDFKSGTITDNPLTNVATTINSAAFANLPAIGATEHLMLVLDPTAVAGAPEVVKVTAHTGSATSLTVVRGQDGSSARQHASGTIWRHAPVASDYDITTPGAWVTWTPTLTASTTNPTLGNSTLTGTYSKMGRLVVGTITLVTGTTFVRGSGTYRLTLPFAVPTGNRVCGSGYASGDNDFLTFSFVTPTGVTTYAQMYALSISFLTTTVNHATFASSSASQEINLSFMYQAAS